MGNSELCSSEPCFSRFPAPEIEEICDDFDVKEEMDWIGIPLPSESEASMEYIYFGFLYHIVAFQEGFLVLNRLCPGHVESRSLFLAKLGPNCDNVL